MNTSNNTVLQKQKFDSIDIMRGIAILLVILVHTSQYVQDVKFLLPIAQYGQMGVQLFFIASAFTLCYTFEFRRKDKEPLKNFYLRRFFRIAPGYYFGILLYFFITDFITYGWDSNKEPINILLNILFLNGLFPDANNTVVPGGWSIGTEMVFYLIFPFLYYAIMRIQYKYQYTYLLLPIFSLVFSFVIQYVIFNLIDSPHLFGNNSFFYFNILNQLPVFCIGISLFIAFRNDKLMLINKQTCIVLFLIFTFISTYLMLHSVDFEFTYVFFPFFSGISFVFVFIILHYHVNSKNLILIKAGELSYSGYLVHFVFAFYLTEKISNKLSFVQADLRLIFVFLLIVTLTFFSAKVIYICIEKPGVNLGKKVINYLNTQK